VCDYIGGLRFSISDSAALLQFCCSSSIAGGLRLSISESLIDKRNQSCNRAATDLQQRLNRSSTERERERESESLIDKRARKGGSGKKKEKLKQERELTNTTKIHPYVLRLKKKRLQAPSEKKNVD
jgi:hypothetical protein